jgi:predicted DNA-binding protein
MQDPAVLKSVSYVVDRKGRRAAVQLSIEDWTAFLDYVENLEDRALAKGALARLRQGPEEAQALPWDEVRAEW